MSHSKKTNRLLGLACVLAVVSGAAVGVMQHEERKEQIRSSDKIVLQIPPESVTALSWSHGSTSLSFHKDGSWFYDGDEAFPVDEDLIMERLAYFENLGVAFEIEDVEDIGQYGLDDPVCTIQITTAGPEDSVPEGTEAPAEADAETGETTVTEQGTAPSAAPAEPSEPAQGSTRQILVGDYSRMDGKRYLSIGDGKVYLVSEDPLLLFSAELREMIDHDEDLSYTSISEIRFSGQENGTIVYEENAEAARCSEDVYFTEQDGKTAALSTDRVIQYLNQLTTLNPIDYVTYKAGQEDLLQYGLDAPELTVSVDYTETEGDTTVSDTFVLEIGRNQAEVAAEQAEVEKDPAYTPREIPAYIRIGGSQIIYEISQDRYEALMAASFNDLRHQEVFAADFEDVTQIDIRLDGNAYSLTAAPSEEEEEPAVWSFHEEEISITGLENSLEALTAAQFTEETPNGQEEISLTLHLEDPNHPELEITLYRYDGSDCLAEVDGESFALIPRSEAVDLIESIRSIVLN